MPGKGNGGVDDDGGAPTLRCCCCPFTAEHWRSLIPNTEADLACPTAGVYRHRYWVLAGRSTRTTFGNVAGTKLMVFR